MKSRLHKIEIRNFKGFREFTLPLEGRHLFETLYDGTHPLKIALDKLQTLDTVRIIEGEA